VGVSQHRDEHLDLCAAYVLGCLDEADRSRLEAHLAEACPVCEGALRDFGGSAVLLAASVPPALPSPDQPAPSHRATLRAATVQTPPSFASLKRPPT